MNMTGKWFVERKMHDGQWSTYTQGYATEQSAKSAVRNAASAYAETEWRIGIDSPDTDIYVAQAHVVPGQRIKWTVIDPT